MKWQLEQNQSTNIETIFNIKSDIKFCLMKGTYDLYVTVSEQAECRLWLDAFSLLLL